MRSLFRPQSLVYNCLITKVEKTIEYEANISSVMDFYFRAHTISPKNFESLYFLGLISIIYPSPIVFDVKVRDVKTCNCGPHILQKSFK